MSSFFSFKAHGLSALLALAAFGPLSSAPAHAQTASTEGAPEGPRTHAETRAIGPDDAVRLALDNHPTLGQRRAERERARLLVEQEQNRYTPVFSADAGVRWGRRPALSPTGLRSTQSSSLVLGTGLRHVLPVGTELALRAEVGRTRRDTVELGDLGAAWDSALRLEATQPLLRGAGEDVGRAQLALARESENAQALEEIVQTEAIASDVLDAWWSLFSAQQALAIEQSALDLARQQLERARVLREAGTYGEYQMMPLGIQLNRVQDAVMRAEANVEQRAVALSRAILAEPSPGLRAQAPSAIDSTPQLPDRAAALARALEHAPALRLVQSRRQSLAVQVALARDAALARLDTVASLDLAGLGTSTGDALTSLAVADGVLVYAGLRLEMPVRNRVRALELDRLQALSVALDHEQREFERDLAHRLDALLAEQRGTIARRDLAQRSAELARQNVEAQRLRVDAGAATMLEVVDALNALRESENQMVQLDVALQRGAVQLRRWTGELDIP